MRPLAPASRFPVVSCLRISAFALIAVLAARDTLAATPAALQQTPGATLPIEVTAAPSRMLADGQVRLSGSTGITGANSAVVVRIQPPGSAPAVQLSGKVASDGRFSVVFSKTTQLGTYQVVAIAPDKKGQATTSFRVVAVEVIPTEIGRAADSVVSAATQGLKVVEQGVQALPASPERAEAQKRLAEIDEHMDDLPAQTAVLKQQLQKVFKARAAVAADNPQWDAYVETLDQWQKDAAARAADLRERMKASAATQRCGRLDAYNEMLTAISETISFVSAPFDFSKSFWTDKIPGGFVARLPGTNDLSPQTKFAAIQTMKLGAAALEGPQGLIMAIPGMVVDVAAYMVQQEFAKFCQKLEGQIAGTFLGESFTRKGEAFLDYTIALDGKLVLMFDKSAPPNKPIGVLGYMEGNGQFKVRDNPAPVVRATPGTVLFHKVISPPGGGYYDDIGQATRSMLPHSFRVPVKGVLAGDSVVLALEPAIHDFGPSIVGRTIYVVLPMGGMVPQIIDTRFPLQKAFPIIDRVMRGRPVLHVSHAGGTRAEGTFWRDTTSPDKTARVRTKLTITACDPGCLMTPLVQPKAKK